MAELDEIEESIICLRITLAEPAGLLGWLFALWGVAPKRRDHSHAEFANYVDRIEGNAIVTTCRVCGDFIGRRPLGDGQPKRSRRRAAS